MCTLLSEPVTLGDWFLTCPFLPYAVFDVAHSNYDVEPMSNQSVASNCGWTGLNRFRDGLQVYIYCNNNKSASRYILVIIYIISHPTVIHKSPRHLQLYMNLDWLWAGVFWVRGDMVLCTCQWARTRFLNTQTLPFSIFQSFTPPQRKWTGLKRIVSFVAIAHFLGPKVANCKLWGTIGYLWKPFRKIALTLNKSSHK